MIIHTVKVGKLRTNCYLVSSENSKETVIIDPGADPQKIIDAIDKQGLLPVMIVNTHAHHDHIGANDILSRKYSIPVAISQKESDLVKEWKSVYFFEFDGIDIESFAFSKMLNEGDIVKAGDVELKVIETPGHTTGGICLYSHGVLFSGDTLFAGDYGKTDFHGGSDEQMKTSLIKLMKLPSETLVYPGHGKATTIATERIQYA